MVVGIHKQGVMFKPINYGTILGYIIDDLEKEQKFKNEIEENPSENTKNMLKDINKEIIEKNQEKEKEKIKRVK